jgi:hypothetical protein
MFFLVFNLEASNLFSWVYKALNKRLKIVYMTDYNIVYT